MFRKGQGLDSLWKDYASAYSKVFPFISFYVESVDMAIRGVEGCPFALDLGCGPGIVAEKLARKSHKVVGIDNDNVMVAYARGELARYDNATVMQQDAHSLSFKSEVFDGIVCNNVLYFVERPLPVLQEQYRVLKINGKLAITGPRPNPDMELLFKVMMRDLEAAGVLDKFSEEIKAIIACNRVLAEKGMKNVYTNEKLESILLNDAQFSKILDSRGCYLEQSYFIVAQK